MNCNKQTNRLYSNDTSVDEIYIKKQGLFLINEIFKSYGWNRKITKNIYDSGKIICYKKNETDEFRIEIMNKKIDILVPIKGLNNSYKTTFNKSNDTMFIISEYLEMHLLQFESK